MHLCHRKVEADVAACPKEECLPVDSSCQIDVEVAAYIDD